MNLRTMGTDMSHRLVQDVVAGGPTFDFVYDATSRVVQTTRTSAGGAVASTSLWYGPGNALVQEVRSNGSEIHRFQGYQERNGTTYAAVLPWLTLEDGLPRYTLTEPDGRAAVVLKPNGSLEAERFVSAYGVELTGLGAYPTYSPSGAWPLGGLHGSEPDTTMGVTHFGARHLSLRGDGMWLQREPLLMAGPTLGDLTHPLRYGAVYAGGNTNLLADRSGHFALAAAPVAGVAYYVGGAAVIAAATGVVVVGVEYASGGAVSDAVGAGIDFIGQSGGGTFAAAGDPGLVYAWEQTLVASQGGANEVGDYTANGTPITQHGGKQMEERDFTDQDVDDILEMDPEGTWNEKHGTFNHTDGKGNTVATRPEDGAVTTVFGDTEGGYKIP